jgi:NADP-dependent 3-hydroxy acid dehydrogenase YdfG
LLPQLRETAQAGVVVPRLLNVTSTGTYAPMPMIAVYTSAKCALARLNDALRQELYGLNIRVIDITPGKSSTITSFLYGS